ncbi:hypothetical protein RKD26_000433 [Streptomyces calvus]
MSRTTSRAPGRLDGGEHGLLDPGHHLDLEVIADVDAVVHHGGPLDGRPCPLFGGDVGGVPADAVDRGTAARAVDEPDGVAAADEFPGQGGAGGTGSEDGVQGAGVVDVSRHDGLLGSGRDGPLIDPRNS